MRKFALILLFIVLSTVFCDGGGSEPCKERVQCPNGFDSTLPVTSCKAGTYIEGDALSCYSSISDSNRDHYRCCNPGSGFRATPDHRRMACPQGTAWYDAGNNPNSACTVCRAGEYPADHQSKEYMSTQAHVCQACPLGHYCPDGKAANQLCAKGNYAADQYSKPVLSRGIQCVTCKQDYACSGGVMTACVEPTASFTGASSCDKCHNTYYKAADGSCQLCPPGSYTSGRNDRAACEPCGASQYSGNIHQQGQEASSFNMCATCPLGATNTDPVSNKCTVRRGYYVNDDEANTVIGRRYISCPEGYACPGTVHNEERRPERCVAPMRSNGERYHACVECSGRRYLETTPDTTGLGDPNTLLNIKCLDCPAHTSAHPDGKALSCVADVGYHGVITWPNNSPASECTPGHYCTGGVEPETPCPLGFEQPHARASACTPCALFKVADSEGQQTCRSCASGEIDVYSAFIDEVARECVPVAPATPACGERYVQVTDAVRSVDVVTCGVSLSSTAAATAISAFDSPIELALPTAPAEPAPTVAMHVGCGFTTRNMHVATASPFMLQWEVVPSDAAGWVTLHDAPPILLLHDTEIIMDKQRDHPDVCGTTYPPGAHPQLPDMPTHEYVQTQGDPMIGAACATAGCAVVNSTLPDRGDGRLVACAASRPFAVGLRTVAPQGLTDSDPAGVVIKATYRPVLVDRALNAAAEPCGKKVDIAEIPLKLGDLLRVEKSAEPATTLAFDVYVAQAPGMPCLGEAALVLDRFDDESQEWRSLDSLECDAPVALTEHCRYRCSAMPLPAGSGSSSFEVHLRRGGPGGPVFALPAKPAPKVVFSELSASQAAYLRTDAALKPVTLALCGTVTGKIVYELQGNGCDDMHFDLTEDVSAAAADIVCPIGVHVGQMEITPRDRVSFDATHTRTCTVTASVRTSSGAAVHAPPVTAPVTVIYSRPAVTKFDNVDISSPLLGEIELTYAQSTSVVASLQAGPGGARVGIEWPPGGPVLASVEIPQAEIAAAAPESVRLPIVLVKGDSAWPVGGATVDVVVSLTLPYGSESSRVSKHVSNNTGFKKMVATSAGGTTGGVLVVGGTVAIVVLSLRTRERNAIARILKELELTGAVGQYILPLRELILPMSDIEVTGPTLGRGGYGTVVKARWRGADVVVKKLHVHLLSDATAVESICAEAVLQADLRHPHVVGFFGVFPVTKTLGLVFEMCDGGDLAKATRGKSFDEVPMARRLRWLQEAAAGLAYLHTMHVAHCDIKAVNMMMAGQSVKIGDFGLARPADAGTSPDASSVMGTPAWLAPEAILEDRYDLLAADVYAFAITMWEVLAGAEPFADVPVLSITLCITEQDARPPIPLMWPSAMRGLLNACWARQPGHRPSMASVAEILGVIN